MPPFPAASAEGIRTFQREDLSLLSKGLQNEHKHIESGEWWEACATSSSFNQKYAVGRFLTNQENENALPRASWQVHLYIFA